MPHQLGPIDSTNGVSSCPVKHCFRLVLIEIYSGGINPVAAGLTRWQRANKDFFDFCLDSFVAPKNGTFWSNMFSAMCLQSQKNRLDKKLNWKIFTNKLFKKCTFVRFICKFSQAKSAQIFIGGTWWKTYWTKMYQSWGLQNCLNKNQKNVYLPSATGLIPLPPG